MYFSYDRIVIYLFLCSYFLVELYSTKILSQVNGIILDLDYANLPYIFLKNLIVPKNYLS